MSHTSQSAVVRVMTWAGGWGRALREQVSTSFERSTGTSVEHHTHVGLRLPGNLERALSHGDEPPFDVVWSNSGPALRMAGAGLTEPLDGLPVLKELHDRARPVVPRAPGRGEWPLVFTYVVYYVLVYRRALFPDGPPRSWRTLEEPRHRRKVALYPGGNGFYPIAQVLGGGSPSDIPDSMQPCWDYLRSLAPQIGELDYSIGMGKLLASGKLDLCFRALTNALAFRDEGLDVGFAAPAEGITDTLDCMWIPAGLPAERVRAARAYIAHALSKEVQTAWCRALGATPVHLGADVPALVREHPGLPNGLDDFGGVLHVPESVKAQWQDRWEQQFELAIAEGLRSESPTG